MRMFLQTFPVYMLLLSTCVIAKPTDWISSRTLKQWGYKKLPTIKYLRNFCDPGIEGKAQVKYQSIKSLKTMRKGSSYYPRYTLVRETYPSRKAAYARYKEVLSPPRKTSKHSKLCYLRRAGIFHHTVYFVHTDAAIFRNREQTRILNKFLKVIKKSR